MYQEITLQLVTNCNLKCTYCFAPKSNNEITSNNFEKFLCFCRKNKPDCIHITGGEPTLHTSFGEIINELSNIAALVIYSNLTVADSIKRIKAKNPNNIVFLANLNERKSYSEKQWGNFEDNVKYIQSNGMRLAIGHTFYKEPFAEEFNEVIDYILKYKIDHFRISQALESYLGGGGLKREQINHLYSYVADSIERWREQGIKAYFDCPVPPCYMEQEVFQKLSQYGAIGTRCLPKAFVMWNLEVTHCYSTIGIGEKRNLFEFQNINQIKDYSKKLLKIKWNTREKEFCRNCMYGEILCGCPDYNIVGKVVERS